MFRFLFVSEALLRCCVVVVVKLKKFHVPSSGYWYSVLLLNAAFVQIVAKGSSTPTMKRRELPPLQENDSAYMEPSVRILSSDFLTLFQFRYGFFCAQLT